MMNRPNAGRAALVAALAVTLGLLWPALASSPSTGRLTPAQRSVSWSGGPLVGGYASGACVPTSCDEYTVTSAVSPAYWSRHPGGLAIQIDWQNPNIELDVFVFDKAGNQLASSTIGGVSEKNLFLYEPPRGPFRIQVQAFDGAATTYAGQVSVVSQNAAMVQRDRSDMRFSPETVVDPQFTTGEPGLWAARDGRIYVDAPWHLETTTSFAWRSRATPSGPVFDLLDAKVAGGVRDPRHRPCSASGGGGDTDLVTDRTGQVYLADLELASVSVATSSDHGTSWQCNAAAATSPDDDRPWLAPAPSADGAGPHVDAYLFYRAFEAIGQLAGAVDVVPYRVQVDVTRDAGRTWTSQGRFAEGLVGQTGSAFTSADGTVYEAFTGSDGRSVLLARSTDQGRTFRVFPVSRRPGWPANVFVTGGADRAGHVYVAWVDSGSYDVLYTYSTDRGRTWSHPRALNPPGTTAVMPWLATGRTGDVAIGWYGTDGKVQPGNAKAAQPWYPWVARSLHAAAPSASFQLARLSQLPTHHGPICWNGAPCQSDHSLADFFKIAIGPEGSLMAAFDDNGRDPTPSDGPMIAPYVVFVRQTSGLGMSRAHAVPTRAETPTRPEVPPSLVFTSPPTVTRVGTNLRISFSLTSGRDLTSALGPPATDAYWTVLWRTSTRVEYVGMHVDRSGATSFFGGDHPVPVSVIPGLSFASYPPAFAAKGTINVRSGTVTVTAPMSAFHLGRGEVLHSIQAFSMTGLGGAQQKQPFDVFDSTAGVTGSLP